MNLQQNRMKTNPRLTGCALALTVMLASPLCRGLPITYEAAVAPPPQRVAAPAMEDLADSTPGDDVLVESAGLSLGSGLDLSWEGLMTRDAGPFSVAWVQERPSLAPHLDPIDDLNLPRADLAGEAELGLLGEDSETLAAPGAVLALLLGAVVLAGAVRQRR